MWYKTPMKCFLGYLLLLLRKYVMFILYGLMVISSNFQDERNNDWYFVKFHEVSWNKTTIVGAMGPCNCAFVFFLFRIVPICLSVRFWQRDDCMKYFYIIKRLFITVLSNVIQHLTELHFEQRQQKKANILSIFRLTNK